MPGNWNHRNWLVQGLSPSELKAISADSKSVFLAKDEVLFEPEMRTEYLYFPAGSVISFCADTGEGASIEVWSVGREGLAGVSALLGETKPFRGVVQIPGEALIAKTSGLRRHFQKRAAFHDAVLRYYHYLLVQISYVGICNNSHGIEQRFMRWLLMIQDRAGTREIKFTQDAIAGILGTRRATISFAAAALQKAGLISYTPGSIIIESRKGLQQAACCCYKMINRRR